MEKILLGVTGVRAEMRGGKTAQAWPAGVAHGALRSRQRVLADGHRPPTAVGSGDWLGASYLVITCLSTTTFRSAN